MRPFSETVKELTPTLVKATIFLFEQTQKTMLPTPTKAHYLFNLRDLSDVFRGVCSSSCNHTRSLSDILRLWYHECSRVFCDRLVLDDRPVFHQNISAVMSEYFGQSKAAVIGKEEPIFGLFHVLSVSYFSLSLSFNLCTVCPCFVFHCGAFLGVFLSFSLCGFACVCICVHTSVVSTCTNVHAFSRGWALMC